MEVPEDANFQVFRECLSTPLIEKSSEQPAKKTRKARGNNRRKTAIKPVIHKAVEANDAEDLAEFIDVCQTSFYHSSSSIDEESSISLSKSSRTSQHLFEN